MSLSKISSVVLHTAVSASFAKVLNADKTKEVKVLRSQSERDTQI